MHSNTNPLAKTTSIGNALIGVDIGGTKTAVCLSASAPDLLWRREFPTLPQDGPQHAIATIKRLIREGITETALSPQAIGVSCGGPLDSTAGLIQRPPNLWTWDDVRITSDLSEATGLPCALENDANAGALAEFHFGAGRGVEHMVFLTLGTGLGAGLILNGALYRGASHLAGEIGHVRLTEHGPVGYGKEGSAEGWASGGGMARLAATAVQDALASNRTTLLTEKLEGLTTRDIGEAHQQGDAVAGEIIALSGRRLGEALAVLVDVLNPQRIVIGGLALRLGETLLGPAREKLHQEALPASVAACEVVPAELGEHIGDIAALCVALQALRPAR